jgi:hypothetical protein
MRSLLALALVAVLAAPLSAQQRSDQARLSFGVGIGYNGGTTLWNVPFQPMSIDGNVDTVDLTRRARPTLGITFLGTYYPNARVGFTAEAHLVGLGHEDRCFVRSTPAYTYNQEICTNINGRQTRGSSSALTVGAMVRPFPWASLQPYLRANVGFLADQQSGTQMLATYFNAEEITYIFYRDNDATAMRPMAALAAGATAFIGRSYQVRLEVKDNIVPLEEVTGPQPGPNALADSRVVYRHVPSFSVALEVVLEKRRGRRY